MVVTAFLTKHWKENWNFSHVEKRTWFKFYYLLNSTYLFTDDWKIVLLSSDSKTEKDRKKTINKDIQVLSSTY